MSEPATHPGGSLRARLQIAIGLVMSILGFAWALKGVDLAAVVASLAGIHVVWLIPFILILFGILLTRAVRWRSTFVPVPTSTVWTFVHIVNIGYLANNVLPFRAGELVRAVLAGRHEDTSIPQALSTILLERLLDGLSTVLLLCIILATYPSVPDVARQAGIVTGLLGVIGIVAMIFAASWREDILRVAERAADRLLSRYSDRIMEFLRKLFDGLEALKQPAVALRIVVLGLCVVALYVLLPLCLFQAFDMHLPLTAAMLIICVTNLGSSIPSTPGFIGVYHSMVVLALTAFTPDRSRAFSFSLVLHGIQYLVFNLLGAFSVVRLSLSMTELRRISQTRVEA